MKSTDKILFNCKEPITIKELQVKTGLKWANLSKHLSKMKAKGWIVELGKSGRSKVIQLNKYKYNEYLKGKYKEISTMTNMMK